MNQTKIIVFGPLPPPIGGVTIFIKNLIDSGKTTESADLNLFSIKSIFLKRFDAAHINASNPAKRLLLLLIGKIIARRVYFTIHGGNINEKNIFNKISLNISNGVYCLNYKIKLKLDNLKIRNFLHTTIFKENIIENKIKLKKEFEPKKILFYANNSKSINGEEIYGANFFASCIKQIVEKLNFETIVVDLSGDYLNTFKSIPRTTYYDSPVNFKDLLTQCDIYVRPTSTDGMSVAVLEAGTLGVPVLASDAVDRPSFAITYKHNCELDFMEKIESMLIEKNTTVVRPSLTSINDFIDFMKY